MSGFETTPFDNLNSTISEEQGWRMGTAVEGMVVLVSIAFTILLGIGYVVKLMIIKARDNIQVAIKNKKKNNNGSCFSFFPPQRFGDEGDDEYMESLLDATRDQVVTITNPVPYCSSRTTYPGSGPADSNTDYIAMEE